jgi:hypothetical protein
LFLLVLFGGAAGIVGAAADTPDAAIAIPFIGLTGMALVIFFLGVSLPGLFAGWGLLTFKPWARILAIVLAILNLIHIPFGTLLGIYALWVLLSRETERLFAPVSKSAA